MQSRGEPVHAPLQVWDRGKARGGIHGHRAVGRDESRAECQRGYVSFPNSPQTQDEAALAAGTPD